MHDCGLVGGRRRHAAADGETQNEAGRAIHSERSGRTSGGSGHANLVTHHHEDTVNQGFCRTSSTYLKINLPKWYILAVSTAVKHNGRGKPQRQPLKYILSKMPKLSSPKLKPALAYLNAKNLEKRSAKASLSCPP